MMRRLLLPLVLLAALVAGLVLADPGRYLETGAPPAEEIVFDRVVLEPGRFILHVRNGVSAPVTVAQVAIDDAFWQFTMDPADGELGRFGSGVITVDYPWVEGEPHVVALVSHTGLLWEHEIAAAFESPTPQPASLGTYALIGILVGLIPVAVGMAFFPAMRDAPARWTNAVLAFTLGLLAFLLVDTTAEGIELSEAVPGAFEGLGLFFGAALVALVLVLALDKRLAGRRMESLALMIAIGIGLHNLGEGLLIGSAFAIGSLALGSALILGFAVHNVTEGPAIVAPLAKGGTLPWGRFLMLAAIAGLPTVLGAWLGAFASYSVLPVVFFGLGAGAILVVLVQVGRELSREGALVTPLNLVAFALGYAVMYATGLLTA